MGRKEKIIKFIKNDKVVTASVIFLIIIIIMGIFAPFIATNNPNESILEAKLMGSSLKYPMGTDQYGRCIFSRCVYGIRTSLGISIIIGFISILIGALVGICSGYYGGIVDTIIMRFCDALLAFPSLILVLIVVGMLGTSTQNIIIAMLLVHWIWFARVTRSMTLSLKEHIFVKASRISGSNSFKVILKHIFPNILPQLIVLFTIDMGGIILQLAGFSFLGIGVQAPTPEWGIMINEGKNVLRQNIMVMVWPSLMIISVILALNIVGEAMRNKVDDIVE